MKLRYVALPALAIALTAGTTTAFAADARPAGMQGDRPGFNGGPPGGRPGFNGGPPGEMRGGPGRRLDFFFEHLDADGNGVVTLDEFLAKPVEKAAFQFDRIDTDDDGFISAEEFAVAGEHRRPRDLDPEAVRTCVENALGEALPERPDPETLFNKIDTNGDGYIDLDELTAAKTERATRKFAEIDADGDGGVTKEELAASFMDRREAREIHRTCVEDLRVEASVVE